MAATDFPNRPVFSGHESFPVRYGWLKKGYDALTSNDGHFFARDEAMVEMGVGKNMVRAIRYWGIAFRLWEPVGDARASTLQTTPMADRLLGSRGWDPFIDEVGTLWLLHAWLVSEPVPATTAWYLFARQRISAFTRVDVVGELVGQAPSVARSTIERDVDVTVRLYLPARGAHSEDSLESPLTALELLHPVRGGEEIALGVGAQPTLPDGIFAAFFSRWLTARGKQAVSFDELRQGAGSPGRVFCLSENALMDRLANLPRWMPAVQFDETAGIRQILVQGSVPTEEEVLAQHFGRGIE